MAIELETVTKKTDLVGDVLGVDCPPIIRDASRAKKRDASIIFIRHGEEDRNQGDIPHLTVLGKKQAEELAQTLTGVLGGLEQKVVIKVLSTSKSWGKETAQTVIETLEKAEDKVPTLRILRPTETISPKPRSKKNLDKAHFVSEDESRIRDEQTRRNEADEPIKFSQVWLEMARQGELGEESESVQQIQERVEDLTTHLQKVVARVPPEGPPIIFLAFTHSYTALATTGKPASHCEAFLRVDLPLSEREFPQLIYDGNPQENFVSTSN